MYISQVIELLLNDHKPAEIAEEIGVSQALVSTWKNKDNDFTPRVNVAARIYDRYEIVVFPYAEEALQEVLERAAISASNRH